MSVIVLSLILIPFCTDALLLPIPLENPHPLNSHELVCHYGLPVGPSLAGTKYQIGGYTPSQISHEIGGYLCSKTIWETKCEEGFFGGTTISYIIHKSPITDNECRDAYHSLLEGEELPTPHFPPEYCSWMAENTKSATYLTLMKHNAYEDPYKNTLVDHVFIGHACGSEVCKTHYDNVKWITGTKLGKGCTVWNEVQGEVFLDPTRNPTLSYLEAEFIPRTPLSKICFGMSYCGLTGYLLDNGLFISITPGDPKSIRLEREVPIRKCAAGAEVSLHPLSSSLATMELQTLEILFNTKCNDVVSKIKSGLNVTVYELGFLNPTYPGVGYSFINVGGRLLSARTRFVPIDSYNITFEESPSIFYQLRGEPRARLRAYNCTWFESPKGKKMCRWYNGLYLTEGAIIPPYSTEEETKEGLDIYAEIQPKFDHHIGLPDLDNETIHTSDQTMDPDYINSDIIGSIQGWFAKWFHYLGLAVSIILIVSVVYMCRGCIYKCCLCCFRCHAPAKVPEPFTVSYNQKAGRAEIKNNKRSNSKSEFKF